MTPQQKRVLTAARSYRGTCSAEWIDGMGADGKGKISRVPARIEELADEYKCVFECIGWRHKTKVYRLVSGPAVEGDSRGVIPPEPASAVSLNGRLFTVGKAQFGYGEEEKVA